MIGTGRGRPSDDGKDGKDGTCENPRRGRVSDHVNSHGAVVRAKLLKDPRGKLTTVPPYFSHEVRSAHEDGLKVPTRISPVGFAMPCTDTGRQASIPQ